MLVRHMNTWVIALWVVLLILAVQGQCNAGEKGLSGKPLDITMAFSPRAFIDADTEEARIVAKSLTKMLLGKVVGGSTDATIYHDMPSLEKAILMKKVDLAVLLSDEYLEVRNRLPIEPIALTARHSGVYDEVVILVRKDGGIRSMLDLMNKRKNIQKGIQGSIFQYWIETLLMKEGVYESKDFFATLKKVEKPSHAVLPVFFKQADACIVLQGAFNLVAELNPQVAQELDILNRSTGTVGGILCVRRGFPAEQRKIVEETLWSLHKEPQARQLLTLFRFDRLVPFRPECLSNMEIFLSEYHDLKIKLARGK